MAGKQLVLRSFIRRGRDAEGKSGMDVSGYEGKAKYASLLPSFRTRRLTDRPHVPSLDKLGTLSKRQCVEGQGFKKTEETV
jgi:hypothetical protein